MYVPSNVITVRVAAMYIVCEVLNVMTNQIHGLYIVSLFTYATIENKNKANDWQTHKHKD